MINNEESTIHCSESLQFLCSDRATTNKHATTNNSENNNKYENTFFHGVHHSTKIRNEKNNQSFFSGNTLYGYLAY